MTIDNYLIYVDKEYGYASESFYEGALFLLDEITITGKNCSEEKARRTVNALNELRSIPIPLV